MVLTTGSTWIVRHRGLPVMRGFIVTALCNKWARTMFEFGVRSNGKDLVIRTNFLFSL